MCAGVVTWLKSILCTSHFDLPECNPGAGSRVGMLQKAIKSPRWEPKGAASYRRILADGVAGTDHILGAADSAAKRNRSGKMSEEERSGFEIPKEMRSMAEASFDQARKAFDKFLAGAQQTAGSIEEHGATVRAGAKDISAKAISYAEQNVQASLDYAQSLLHAKDLTEVMRLHSGYVQAQMRSLAEQASEMGQLVSRAAMDAAKPKT
jgi:phasin